MKALLGICAVLIVGLIAVHVIGCGEDITQEIDPVAFVSASPQTGSVISTDDTITVTFDGVPTDIDINTNSKTKVSKTGAKGKTVTIYGPFALGELSLTVTWHSGNTTLAYTVIESNPGTVDDDVGEDIDSQPIHTDGKPINVIDATFETVVLEAELPVVLEFWAVW